MSITQIILLIALLGGIGGIVNCAISREFGFPHFDQEAKVWRPGWLGNVLVGATAAVAVWGVYGPLASYDLVQGSHADIHLTVSQLLVSLVIGLGGGKILTLMVEKQARLIANDEFRSLLKSITKEKDESS